MGVLAVMVDLVQTVVEIVAGLAAVHTVQAQEPVAALGPTRVAVAHLEPIVVRHQTDRRQCVLIQALIAEKIESKSDGYVYMHLCLTIPFLYVKWNHVFQIAYHKIPQ